MKRLTIVPPAAVLRLFSTAALCLLLALTLSATAQPPSLTVHVVQRGEDLSSIAAQYELSAAQLADANSVSSAAGIRIGQRLIIPIEAAQPQPPLTHTVVTGETLASIARAYDKTLDELVALNALENANRIFIGQQLVIAPAPEPAPTAETPATPTAAATPAEPAEPVSDETGETAFTLTLDDAPETFVHVVKKGETLFQIGMGYNMTVTVLAEANSILDPTQLYIGQQLIIPGIELPRLARDLPPLISDFTIDPLVLVEGKTARIKIQTTEPVTIRGRFLERDLIPVSEQGGTQHSILFGIPMFTEYDIYPLELEIISEQDGTAAPIDANIQVINGAYGRQNITIDNTELLAPAVENEEMNLLIRITSPFTPEKSWDSALSLPAAATMNAFFGALRSYNGSPYDRYHQGLDFAGAPGTSVLAAADGTVVLADMLHIRGNTVAIDHGWGLYTVYAHQTELWVAPGETVKSGQVIGTIGSTGRSTGPHLHWEVWIHGVNVDPLQWVQETFP